MTNRPDYSSLAGIKSASQKRQETVIQDIAIIDEAISSDDEEQLKNIHMMIDGKYSAYITNLGQSTYGYIEKYGFDYKLIGKESLIHNLTLMKAKLQGFNCDFPVKSAPALSPNNISVNVSNTNTVNVQLSFEQAKQVIDDMPGLTDEDTDALKEKIDRLESISNENISKKKKWEKVKSILAFALDKGADVAITIMGLILQMKLGN